MELVGVESFFRKSAKATIKQKKTRNFEQPTMRWIFNTYIYVAYMHGAYVEINEHTEKNTVASDSFIYTNESNNRMAQ